MDLWRAPFYFPGAEHAEGVRTPNWIPGASHHDDAALAAFQCRQFGVDHVISCLLRCLPLFHKGANLPREGEPDEVLADTCPGDGAGAVTGVGACADQRGISDAAGELALHASG